MPYTLHEDISFCRLEDRVVFLDLRIDRYFLLSSELEKAFVDYLEHDGSTDADISRLLERGILKHGNASFDPPHITSVDRPSFSALERSRDPRVASAVELLEVFATVCTTRVQLRSRSLKAVLQSLASYRRRMTPRPTTISADAMQYLLDTTAVFMRMRLYVPFKTSCLLDSLALAKFLARHGLHADIVFGVTGDPFSAHCWLQMGGFVLNDTVGSVNTYTPIRLI